MAVGFGSAGSIFVNIGAKLDGLTTGLKDAGTKLDKFAAKAGQFGTKLTMSVTAPLAAIGGVATTAFSKIDEGMRTVNTIAKESEGQLKKTTDELLKIGVALGKRPTELTSALYDINSSSFVGAEGLKVLEAAAKAGVAGLASTQSAAKAITGVLNAFGLESSEAMNVSDALFKSVEKGVVTFDQLSQHMGSSISTAQAIGVSYDDLFATIATMTRGGIESAEAFTAVNMAMVKMIEGGDELDAIANKMGHASIYAAVKAEGLGKVIAQMALETNGDAKAIQELGFEVRAFKAMANLASNGGKEFNKDLEAMANKAGATQAAFEEQSKAFSFSIKVLKATLESAGYYIGEVLAPKILNIANALRNAGNWFLNLDKKTKKLIVTIAGIAAAIGPVLLLGKAFLAVKGAIVAVRGALFLISTNPLSLLIGAVVALGVAIINTYGDGNKFIDRSISLMNKLKSTIRPTLDTIKTLFGNIKREFSGLIESARQSNIVTKSFSFMSASARLFVGWIEAAITRLADLGDGGETLSEKINSAFKVIVHGISNLFLVTIPKSINVAIEKTKELYNIIKTYIGDAGAGAVLKTAAENIGIIFENVFHNISIEFKKMISEFAATISAERKIAEWWYGEDFAPKDWAAGSKMYKAEKQAKAEIGPRINGPGNTWDKDTYEKAVRKRTKEILAEMSNSEDKKIGITDGVKQFEDILSASGKKDIDKIINKSSTAIEEINNTAKEYSKTIFKKIEKMLTPSAFSVDAASVEKVAETAAATASASGAEAIAKSMSSMADFDAIRAELGLGAPGAGMTSAAVAPADTLSSKGHNLPWFNKMMGWSQPVAPATTSATQTLDTLTQAAGGTGTGAEPTATIRDGTGRAVQALKDIGSIILEMAGEFELVKAQISTARA